MYPFTGLDHWTGLLDWTTGLAFDPEILARNGHFALVGMPVFGTLSYESMIRILALRLFVHRLAIEINLAPECTVCITLPYFEVRIPLYWSVDTQAVLSYMYIL